MQDEHPAELLVDPASPTPLSRSMREFRKVIRGTYYPHIDGLRCLAVLPVVLYHLLMRACPAGFMGVDVFFVISGYLICGGILRDLQTGTFSMAAFYHRRIRRIFPAYFALVAVVLLAGVGLFHWAHLLPLARSALFSAFFSSNIYFWLDADYFQPIAHGNPLLNLWSLGVEEQFYIIIPLASLVLWKLRPGILIPAFIAGLCLSLGLCLYLDDHGESTTAFYLLPTRAWELFAGAILAAAPPAGNSRRWSTILSLLGLGLVLASYWSFSTANAFWGSGVEIRLPWIGSLGFYPFPGLITVPVILGSLLLIRYGGSGLVSHLLCSKPFVGVGKISYSLYLWHWPLIVFFRYVNFDRQPFVAAMAALVLSFAAAYISWRCIEMPPRLNPGFTPRVAFAITILGCASLAWASSALVQHDGLRDFIRREANACASRPHRFVPEAKIKSLAAIFQPPSRPPIDPTFLEPMGAPGQKPSFCLVGDSHAEVLAPGLSALALAHHRSGLRINLRMSPFFGADERDLWRRCLRWVGANPNIRDVYLVGRWLTEFHVTDGLPEVGDKGKIAPVVLDAETERLAEGSFRRTALWFGQHGKRVFVFTCVPEYGYSTSDILARSMIIPLHDPIEISRQDYVNRQLPITKILNRLRTEGLITVAPLGDAFISGDHTVFMSPDGKPYYRDTDHLTREGATHALEFIAPILWGDH